MATGIVKVDRNDVVNDIRASLTIIQQSEVDTFDKHRESERLVYRALALHPCLEYLHPPYVESYWHIADIEWYFSPTSYFAKLRDRWSWLSSHFYNAAKMGNVGLRARAMMLLCWVLGHKLKRPAIRTMLSDAVSDALQGELLREPLGEAGHSTANDVGREDTMPLLAHVLEVEEVQAAFQSIATMIITRLPLQDYINPCYGDDYLELKGQDDVPCEKQDFLVYGTAHTESLVFHQFDIKTNPSVLLRPSHHILIPRTILTKLAIRWCTDLLGLGQLVSPGQLPQSNAQAYWKADVPVTAPNDATVN